MGSHELAVLAMEYDRSRVRPALQNWWSGAEDCCTPLTLSVGIEAEWLDDVRVTRGGRDDRTFGLGSAGSGCDGGGCIAGTRRPARLRWVVSACE